MSPPDSPTPENSPSVASEGSDHENPKYLGCVDIPQLPKPALPDLGPPASLPPLTSTTPWLELLARLARAAWFVYEPSFAADREEDGGGDVAPENHVFWPTRRWYHVTCAEDILWPPMSASAVAANERRLGWLPQDLKEMAMVANGFWGGNHSSGIFMFGGWQGLDSMTKAPADTNILSYFTDIGNYDLPEDKFFLYSTIPPQENTVTEYTYVLFLPDTWAAIWQEVAEWSDWDADGYTLEDGDYAIGVYTLHTQYNDILEAGKDCFKKWVTRETQWLEEDWVAGKKVEYWGGAVSG